MPAIITRHVIIRGRMRVIFIHSIQNSINIKILPTPTIMELSGPKHENRAGLGGIVKLICV